MEINSNMSSVDVFQAKKSKAKNLFCIFTDVAILGMLALMVIMLIIGNVIAFVCAAAGIVFALLVALTMFAALSVNKYETPLKNGFAFVAAVIAWPFMLIGDIFSGPGAKNTEIRLKEKEMKKLKESMESSLEEDIMKSMEEAAAKKAEEKKAEEKKAEEKKAEEKKAEEKKAEEKKAEEKTAEEKKSEEKKAEEKKAEEKKSDEKKPEEKKRDENRSDEKQADGTEKTEKHDKHLGKSKK